MEAREHQTRPMFHATSTSGTLSIDSEQDFYRLTAYPMYELAVLLICPKSSRRLNSP